MARPRVNQYVDIELNDKQMKKIKQGHAVHLRSTKRNLSLAIRLKESKKERKIKKLEAELRKLKKITKK